MADKFLLTGGGGGVVNLSNGSINIFSASLGADNLTANKALKTNSLKQLISSNLEISDVNNLQTELDSSITNPFNGTLQTKGNLIEDSKLNIPALTIKTNDANLVNSVGVINFTDSTDSTASKVGLNGFGGLVLTNNNVNGQVYINADNSILTIDDNTSISSFNTKLVVPELSIEDTIVNTPSLKIKTTDTALLSETSGHLHFTDSSDAVAGEVGMDGSGDMSIINNNANSTLSIVAGGKGLSIDSLANLSSFSTDILCSNASVNGDLLIENTTANGTKLNLKTSDGPTTSNITFLDENDVKDGAIIYQAGSLQLLNNLPGQIDILCNGKGIVINNINDKTTFNTDVLIENLTVDGAELNLKTTDGNTNGRILFSNSSDDINASIDMSNGFLNISNDIGGNLNLFSNSKGIIINSINDKTTFNTSTLLTPSITGTTNPPVSHEFPDKPMVGYESTQGFVITQTALNSNLFAWKLFDNITTGDLNIWASLGNYTPAVPGLDDGSYTTNGDYGGDWIQIECPIPIDCNGYTMTVREGRGNNYAQNPYAWRLYGTNDDTLTTWTVVNAQDAGTTWTDGEAKTYSFTPSDKYTYFRFVFNKIASGLTAGAACAVAEMTLTSPTETPTTDSLEIKSSLNVSGSVELRNVLTVMGKTEILDDLTIGGSFSFNKPIGELYWDSNLTSMSSSGVWVPVSGATSSADHLVKFTDASTNRLLYTGQRTLKFHCGASFSFAQVGGGTVNWTFALYKNGTRVGGSLAQRQTTNNAYGSTAIHKIITLEYLDYIELWVNGNGASNDIIVSQYNMFAIGLPNPI